MLPNIKGGAFKRIGMGANNLKSQFSRTLTLDHWISQCIIVIPYHSTCSILMSWAVLWFSHTSSPWVKLEVYVHGPKFILMYFPVQYGKIWGIFNKIQPQEGRSLLKAQKVKNRWLQRWSIFLPLTYDSSNIAPYARAVSPLLDFGAQCSWELPSS